AIVFGAVTILKVDHVHSGDTNTQESHVVVVANRKASMRKLLFVAGLVCRAPDSIDEPCRGRLLPGNCQIAIADHVEKNYSLDLVKPFLLLEPLDHVAASVGMILVLQALAPLAAECLLAVKEDEPVGELWLLFCTAQDSRKLEDGPCTGATIIRT